MIRLNPLNPIFFNPSNDDTLIGWRGVQKFCKFDHIMWQIVLKKTFLFCDSPLWSGGDTGRIEGYAYPTITIKDLTNDTSVVYYNNYATTQSAVTPNYAILNSWYNMANDEQILTFHLQGLASGAIYQIVMEFADQRYEKMYRLESMPFAIYERGDEMLDNTLEIRYAMHDNMHRQDGVFVFPVTGTPLRRYYFTLRVDGGIKDSGWQFGIDNENFTAQNMDLLSVHANAYRNYQLTIGDSGDGVPVWFADLLNEIMSCDYIYINGKRVARNESETPEATQSLDNYNTFFVSQAIRMVTIDKEDLPLYHEFKEEGTSNWFYCKGRPRLGEYLYTSVDDSHVGACEQEIDANRRYLWINARTHQETTAWYHGQQLSEVLNT